MTQVNEELSISSMGHEISLNQLKIIVDNVFAYNVALNIMQDSDDLEPLSVDEDVIGQNSKKQLNQN